MPGGVPDVREAPVRRRLAVRQPVGGDGADPAPEPAGLDDAAAALLDEAEDIVNAAGAAALADIDRQGGAQAVPQEEALTRFLQGRGIEAAGEADRAREAGVLAEALDAFVAAALVERDRLGLRVAGLEPRAEIAERDRAVFERPGARHGCSRARDGSASRRRP